MVDLGFLSDAVESAQREHRERIAALYRGERLDRVPCVAGPFFGASHGLWGTNEPDMLGEPEAWIADVLADMERQAVLLADPVTFCPAMVEMDPLGVRFVDALFDAPVEIHERQYWSLGIATPPGELAPPDVRSHPAMRQALHLTEVVLARTAGRLLIANPVLSCVSNSAMNLFGGRILEELLVSPESGAHALATIHGAIAEGTRIFQEAIPAAQRRNSVGESRYAPEGFGQIDGCATQLLSAELYRDHFAAFDRETLALSPHGGMIHLCGAHAQHIPVWREMPELRAVQTNDRATEDLEHYFGGLREDQILYVSPTETTPVERVLEITGGRRLVLQAFLGEPIPL